MNNPGGEEFCALFPDLKDLRNEPFISHYLLLRTNKANKSR